MTQLLMIDGRDSHVISMSHEVAEVAVLCKILLL
jgi:hypothetical protein